MSREELKFMTISADEFQRLSDKTAEVLQEVHQHTNEWAGTSKRSNNLKLRRALSWQSYARHETLSWVTDLWRILETVATLTKEVGACEW